MDCPVYKTREIAETASRKHRYGMGIRLHTARRHTDAPAQADRATTTRAATLVFPFRVSHRCNEVISTASADSHPRGSLPLFRMHMRACTRGRDTSVSVPPVPFPRLLYCSRYAPAPLAIYIGYLCNGSSWFTGQVNECWHWLHATLAYQAR